MSGPHATLLLQPNRANDRSTARNASRTYDQGSLAQRTVDKIGVGSERMARVGKDGRQGDR